MTGILASVANLHEAKIAFREDIDIIDLKDPAGGVLGAVTTSVVRQVVAFVAHKRLVSATIGDVPMQAPLIDEAIATMGTTGVDMIKVGIFNGLGDDVGDDVVDVIKAQAIKGAQAKDGQKFSIVMVFFADNMPGPGAILGLAQAGIRGMMLDTADKTKGNLRTQMADETIGGFIAQARSYGLLAGLAGSLAADDIAPLLRLRPDYLGFRGALCRGRLRTQTLDRGAVRKISCLVKDGTKTWAA